MIDRGWMSIPVQDNSIEYSKEGWVIKSSWPRRGGRDSIMVTISVRYNGIGGGMIVAPQRLNILSSSSTDKVVRAMNRMGDNKRDTQNAHHLDLQAVLADISYWYQSGSEIEQPDPTVERAEVRWMLYPVWPASGITGLAAAPGSYKSYIAQAIQLGLHYDSPLLHGNTRSMGRKKILYLDWEDGPTNFADRLRALQKAAGLESKAVLDYKRMMIGLADAAETIRDAVTEREYDGIVIDSMSAAISGAMKEDDSVNAFYDEIHSLAVPAFVLAHKSIENQEKHKARFFGSGMSEARVRMAWNAELDETGTFVKWQCFKDNNHGLRGKELAWRVDINTHGVYEKRVVDSVGFTEVNPESVQIGKPKGAVELTKTEEIRKLFAIEGPMKRDRVAQELNLTRSQVDTAMRPDRNEDSFVRLDDGRWTNR